MFLCTALLDNADPVFNQVSDMQATGLVLGVRSSIYPWLSFFVSITLLARALLGRKDEGKAGSVQQTASGSSGTSGTSKATARKLDSSVSGYLSDVTQRLCISVCPLFTPVLRQKRPTTTKRPRLWVDLDDESVNSCRVDVSI